MRQKYRLLILAVALSLLVHIAAAEPQLRSWAGTPPPPLSASVSANELIISDVAGDQYKYYRPDWSWPITSDLDILEARLYSDGSNLYLRFKFSTMRSKYSAYVMAVMDFTPELFFDGFSEWLPDWSDTKLPWKWDAIVGVNLGKSDKQPFIFYRSWNPTFAGQLAVDEKNAVIEALVPMTYLPDFPKDGKVKILVVVFANDYGGIWDPGKKNAYDPRVGIYVDEDFYACNVYDVAGLGNTWDEVYGGWSTGNQEVSLYTLVEVSKGLFSRVADYGRQLSYARTLARRTVIWPPLPGALRTWAGTPPMPTPGYGVYSGEAVLTDPAGDQYKYYRPDWSWPITSDLDILEARLYSDGSNLYLRFKFSTMQNTYSYYIMVPIDFTPENAGDGFSEWLPDWSDTKLPWKWDAIIGVNLGKYNRQPFIFYRSWSPTPAGQLAIDQANAVVEAAVPLSALPGFPLNGKIRYTIVVFANSYGGVWNPGGNNAVDPATGRSITEDDYASNVYDIAGQAPTSADVYGGWGTGDQTVDTSFTVTLSNGIITSA